MIYLNDKYTGKSIIIEKNRSPLATDMPETHSHSHHELYFLLSGKRRYFVGHKIFSVSPGNLVVIPENELHRTGALAGMGYERYVTYFSDEALDGITELIGKARLDEFLELGCVQFSAERAKRLRERFDTMYAEQTRDDEFAYAAEKNLLCDVIIETLRHGKPKNCATGEGADKIQLVAAYISENYASEITLDFAAEMACMEKTYFSKRFKTLTGFGFCEYLTRTRINAAQALLLSSELNVSEISDACGFSTSNYFGDVFRRLHGASPSEYRKKMKNR